MLYNPVENNFTVEVDISSKEALLVAHDGVSFSVLLCFCLALGSSVKIIDPVVEFILGKDAHYPSSFSTVDLNPLGRP